MNREFLMWLILWQGRARFAGLVAMVAAFWLWSGAERPSILVADSGGLVGVMTETGRALSKSRGAGFVASVWLENDGDGVAQPDAAERWPGEGGRVQVIRTGLGETGPGETGLGDSGLSETGLREIVHVIGKRAAAGFDDCKAGQVVVSSVPLALTGPCEVFDPLRLRATGSLAITDKGIITAQGQAGRRIWNTPQSRRRVAQTDQ